MGLVSGYGDEVEKFSKLKHVRHVMRDYAFLRSEVVGRLDICPGGGDSAYERDGDARRPAKGCNFQILVSLN